MKHHPKLKIDPFIDRKDEIAKSNALLLKKITFGAFMNMTALSVISPFLGGFSDSTWLYITCSILTGAFCLYGTFFMDRYPKAVLPLFYVFLAALCAYAVALSAFLYPEIHAVTLIGIFVLVPIVILDRSWRVNTVFCCYFAVACVLTFQRKPLNIAVDDCTTAGAFMIFGMLIGNYVRKIRTDAIVQQHTTELQRDFDMLTLLPNRRVLFETLGRMDNGSERKMDGMFMIDVDDFKMFNDQYGHQAGDECLRGLGAFLARFSREEATTVFRYGGEEFLGFWFDGKGSSLQDISERLVREVQSAPEISCDITISVGYAEISEGISSEGLISMADLALYDAKRLGKCRAERFTPETATNVTEPSFRKR